ncbi:MAG TPA: ribonuclease III [Kofleriaceae bacterium]|nr:ribonuclease III [Kofleriaceae bacterium]
MTIRDVAPAEARLGYVFDDPELFRQALTHRSFANEHRAEGIADNERLEFLGDAVLDLVVGHMLMRTHAELAEGELSVARAQVVSEVGLAEAAMAIELGPALYLGKGEERTGGREKPSILADAFEAVIAAVYLDGGLDAAWALVDRVFGERLRGIDLAEVCDYKTRLQERCQALFHTAPTYRIVSESGPDHDKTFEVSVSAGDGEMATASGKSKKAAEQRAARAALATL